jgi:hypothetical protein
LASTLTGRGGVTWLTQLLGSGAGSDCAKARFASKDTKMKSKVERKGRFITSSINLKI